MAGRPREFADAAPTTVYMDSSTLTLLDGWRLHQDDKPSRSRAIRQLVRRCCLVCGVCGDACTETELVDWGGRCVLCAALGDELGEP